MRQVDICLDTKELGGQLDLGSRKRGREDREGVIVIRERNRGH